MGAAGFYMSKFHETDTTQFFLDGSPKEMGFFAREKPGAINWPGFNLEIKSDETLSDNTKIEILRPLLFFYGGEKTTLGKLREFNTSKAISLFIKDDYIKILKDNK